MPAFAVQLIKWSKNSMINQYLRKFKLAIPVFTLVLSVAGCSGKLSQPSPSSVPTASPSSTIDETAIPTASEEPTLTPTAAPTPTMELATDPNVRYQDNFADPSSGWPQEEYDNYFIGYHEPSYYHVDVRSPTDKELVPVPDKKVYSDITIETKVLTDPNNTDANGDFSYGLAFRRSGSQYYAFTISPRTKKWFVLKSSPSQLEVLKEGSDDSIQGLEAEDTLRVDAKGSTFFFRINDRLVGQVSDADFAEGEVGLYVQTFDSPRAHTHFDSLTVRDVDAPQLVCSVTSIAMRVRSGPSTAFDPPIAFLARGDNIEPQGRSLNGKWIQVRVEASDQQGWVFYNPDWMSCNIAIADLPVIEP